MRKIESHKYLNRFLPAIIVSASSAIILVSFCYFSDIAIMDLLYTILNSQYNPDKNIIFSIHFSRTNIYQLVYSILFLSFALLALISKTSKNKELNLPFLISRASLVIYVLITLLLMKSWVFTLYNQTKIFSGKTTEAKYKVLDSKNVYLLAQYYKSILSPRQSAQFITDLDMTQDPGMFSHRQLAYFLYPIDIREIRKETPDIVIFFAKDHAFEYIPENFEILSIFDKKNLIAAKKKE